MKLNLHHIRLPKTRILLVALGFFLLSFVSSYYFSIKPSVDFQQRLLQNYVEEGEREGVALLQDTALMRRLVLHSESLSEFQMLEKKGYGIFLFAETLMAPNLLFWNTQKFLPSASQFNSADGSTFQRLSNGYYVVHKRTMTLQGMSNKVTAFIIIPVLSQYYIETDYLVKRFIHDEDAIDKIALASGVTQFPIKSISGNDLFHIRRVTHLNQSIADSLTVGLRILSLLFLLLYLHLLAASIVLKTRALYGILALGGVLLLIRALLFRYPELFALDQFELFEPVIYATTWYNRSLGDLLINSVFLCWIILFSWEYSGKEIRMPKFLKGNGVYLAGALAIIILIITTFQYANIVQGLVENSKISFNVSDVFSLDQYSAIGFIVLAFLSLSFYYFSRLLFRFIFPAFRGKPLFIYFGIAVLGLLYLTIQSGNEIVLFHLPVLLWLVIYTLLVSREQFIINRFSTSVAGLLFWIFVFSVSLSVIILQGNRTNELRVRKGIAEKYDQLTDPSSERIMSIAITYLNNRFLLQNFPRFRNEQQARFIRDSIISSNFAGYTNRYDTRIFVFDSMNRPVFNDDPTSFEDLNTIFNVQSRSTGIPDLYYHETAYDQFTYLTKRDIKDSTSRVGTFFIVSTPRQYGSSDALYPELFRSLNRNDPSSSPLYSYAIYNNGLLISSSSKYPFQISLMQNQFPLGEFTQRSRGDFNELWYKASNKKLVLVAKKQDSLLESITLFSYLFCAFLIMVGIIQLIYLLIRIAQEGREFKLLARLTIRSQIHGTVIFITVLSFIIIGAATISFFISRYNRNNQDRLSQTADIMMKEMQKPLSQAAKDSPSVRVDSLNLKGLVKEVSDIHNVDVNVYNLDGALEITSDEDVYNKGILSSRMHPLAYYHLNRLREVQRFQQEEVSSLHYLSIYTAVRDEKGNVVKYLNIPYFSSQLDLQQEISNFFVTIMNLNAFIFLIAGIIALFITNKITQSFSVIGEKMRDITLGKTNEQITWNKKDEIGELVKEYNRMVRELETSAEALAKSEREGAWREMARQVAHEIKNPLTPMKLSIQYMQRAINSNSGNIKELTASVANTLIEQIDHLSKIAADFSQFANIGNNKIELVDLHQILHSLVELYRTNPKVEIDWKEVRGSLIVKADRTHMNRLFTNLFANAVDACAAKPVCKLLIREERIEGGVIISIQDNGEGIPEEVQPRIFTPNFTTKTSGTGLGLAMCMGIVEQIHGHIWFETKEGVGTTFFVKLPVV